MTLNVTVTYVLSAAGQRAALLSGRPATYKVTEVMQTDDTSLVDRLTILPDGSLSLDAAKPLYGNHGEYWGALQLDTPPTDLQSLLDTHTAYLATFATEEQKRREEAKAQRAEQQRKDEERAAADYPIVEHHLAELEARNPLEDSINEPDALGRLYSQGRSLQMTPEQRARGEAIYKNRKDARAEAAAVAAQAEQDHRATIVAEHGGYLWERDGGMADFRGYNLWRNGQTRRWVGVFSAAKGIDRFLNSPRGEMVWEVSSLTAGMCIQGGGFDTNSRGKRRNESEWFGVVIRNDAASLVVEICDSRAAALKASRKGAKS